MKLLHRSTLDMDLDGPDKNNCEVSKLLMSFFLVCNKPARIRIRYKTNISDFEHPCKKIKYTGTAYI